LAIPKIFVSSTCYDLAEERAQLERFILSYGFQPILSEYSDVFYDPDEHTHDSCVQEVKHCDLFILIISGRFGGKYISGTGESITQAEYNEARKLNIPIFSFVKHDVLQAQLYFKENIKSESKEFANKIFYPAIQKQTDAVPIFSFIQSVQNAKDNNAIESYSSFSDIESHLRKQWAGLFYSLLQKRKQQVDVEHISTILDKLSGSSAKLESLVESIHSGNQGEEKTQEIIIKTATKQATESFFIRLIEIMEDLFKYGELREYSITTLKNAAKSSPQKFDSYIDYINSLKLGIDVVCEENEITFYDHTAGIGLGFPDDAPENSVFVKSFNSGVKESSKEIREDFLLFMLSKYINKANKPLKQDK
jgi:hypothetical protein